MLNLSRVEDFIQLKSLTHPELCKLAFKILADEGHALAEIAEQILQQDNIDEGETVQSLADAPALLEEILPPGPNSNMEA